MATCESCTDAPVNTALIKNYADISPFLKDTDYNSSGGKNYGIPHGWGANYLMYNPDVVTTAPAITMPTTSATCTSTALTCRRTRTL